MIKLPVFSFRHLPAIPVEVGEALETVITLGMRELQIKPAKHGLSTLYTIQDTTTTGYNFLYGKKMSTEAAELRDEMTESLKHRDNDKLLETLSDHVFGEKEKSPSFLRFVTGLAKSAVDKITGHSDEDEAEAEAGEPLTQLSLEKPEQYSMAWTVLPDVYGDSQALLPQFASTLEDADAATEQFWPTISEYGQSYNLLVAQKLGSSRLPDPKGEFADVWKEEWTALEEKGLLYAIDMRILDGFKAREVDCLTRFNPGTVTLLEQNPETKDLTPIAVRVAGYEGEYKQVYVRGSATPSAWLYALQAAKSSITVYGIWLGHVYHWHIVTAAMQYTMFKSFSKDHPIYQLVAPQSKYLIGFDTILLMAWKLLAPPTAIDTPRRFLKLCDSFAKGRTYFDDDPPTALERLGVTPADFSHEKPWDKLAFASNLFEVWEIVGTYVQKFVDVTYATDQDVMEDDELRKWIELSSAEHGGNIRGLPAMVTKEALVSVLQSLIYRITIHGSGRLTQAVNPGLTFVGNYPPCLQDTLIPATDADLTTQELLRKMPVTGTIGEMVVFYFAFVYSTPTESLIPIPGFEEDLFFPGGLENEQNQALVEFRHAMADFMGQVSPGSPQLYQWPMNVEL